MASWLERVGELTFTHRKARAERLDAAARIRERKARNDGATDSAVKDAGQWHRSRARGQRDRVIVVQSCRQTKVVVVTCQACANVCEEAGRCRVGLLCVSCRGKIASQKRARFSRAREAVMLRARKGGFLRIRRSGGRWSEKLVTLTAPHIDGHTVPRRIELVRKAWPFFLRMLNAHMRELGAYGTQWLRNFEWTPGSDDGGHPHIHLWFFGPYLPHADVVAWWARALECAGYAAEELEDVVVDVRAVLDGEKGAFEVIKYLTKDLAADGEKIAPELYAEVYVALDGARTTQGARGFLKLGDAAAECFNCGAVGCFTVKVREAPAPETDARNPAHERATAERAHHAA